MVRPSSTGRRRIEIKFIEDKSKRQVTFSKHRPTLFEPCSDLALEFDVRIVVIVFSEAGKAFAFGTPSADIVLGGKADGDDNGRVEAMKKLRWARDAVADQVVAEVTRMKAVGDKVIEANGEKSSWWETDPNTLGAAELPEFARALERLKKNMCRYEDKLARRPLAAVHAGF